MNDNLLPPAGGCKWPFGQPGKPGFCYCGATPVEKKPYCQKHFDAAYTKATYKLRNPGHYALPSPKQMSEARARRLQKAPPPNRRKAP